jgi:hypothetical protein
VRDQPPQEPEAVDPQKVSKPVKPDGVQPGITAEDLPHGPGCRIIGEYRLYVFLDTVEHAILSLVVLWRLAGPAHDAQHG